QRRDGEADELAVGHRVEAEIALADGLLDVLDLTLLPRLDGDQTRLGDADGGHLLDRRGHAVVVDPDAVEHARVGPAGAHLGQVAAERLDRFVDARAQLLEYLVQHDRSLLPWRARSLAYLSPGPPA